MKLDPLIIIVGLIFGSVSTQAEEHNVINKLWIHVLTHVGFLA